MSFGKEIDGKLASTGDHSSPGLKYLSKFQEAKEKKPVYGSDLHEDNLCPLSDTANRYVQTIL